MNHTTDPHRAVLTVTVTTRPDGGHYFDQADFAGHVTEWVRAALKGQHAVAEVTIVDQSAVPVSSSRAALSDAERTMLAYALDQAQEKIWSEDGFTDEDQAAVTSLRRLAAEAPQPDTETQAALKRAHVALAEQAGRDQRALTRIRQMADAWEQQLPEVIRTPAVVSAIRAALPPVVGAQPTPQHDEDVPVHACPGPGDDGMTPCCHRPPFEMPGERITRDPDKVTCKGAPRG